MIEVNFKDRIPREPGQVTLTPVAGATNTYKLERNDDPSEVGTPLNKATFDSIIHSRLTGRYYALDVAREVLTSQTLQTDPIPSTGWVENSYTDFTSGSYKLTSSYPDYPNLAVRAFDNSTTTYFSAESDSGETWVAIDFGVRILVTKLSVSWFSYDYDSFRVSFQGSNNGEKWTEIAKTTGNRETKSSWAFENSTEYSMYRLVFNQGTENAMQLYDWSITGMQVNTYKNTFTTDGLPTEWTEGQRLTIQTPSDVNTVGVSANTVNGVAVNTILQPSKRYELRYNGAAFVAKEV